MYDLAVVLTSGGPAGATETIALRVIKVGFTQNKLSYGTSLAVYMLIIVGVFSVTLVHYLRKREEKLIL
jgi:ABC-type sugar transport system permease subunit